MAKKKKGEGEGEAEGEEGEGKKGGLKPLIIKKVIPLLLVAFVIAKMTVLKPPPPTPAQLKAAEEKAEYDLKVLCSLANDLEPPKAEPAHAEGEKKTEGSSEESTDEAAATEGESTEKKTTPTTEPKPPSTEGAPVLTSDPVTINLADGHLLKFAVGLQFPAGALIKEIEANNEQAKGLDLVIKHLRTMSKGELGPKALEPLRQELGYDVCHAYEGHVLTIYFTDFVAE